MKNNIYFLLLLIMPLVSPALIFAETEQEEAKKEFQRLKSAFENEISYPPYSEYNFVDRYWDSDSGRNIIAMGKRALPFIMEEIKNGRSYYTVAAEKITGIKMRGPMEEDLRQEWLAWWEENKDNPEWNVFIKGAPAPKAEESLPGEYGL